MSAGKWLGCGMTFTQKKKMRKEEMKENGGRRLGGEHGGIWIHAVFPALYRRCWKDVVIQAGLAYRRRCSVNEKKKKKNLCVLLLLWNITFSKMCHHEMKSYKEKNKLFNI